MNPRFFTPHRFTAWTLTLASAVALTLPLAISPVRGQTAPSTQQIGPGKTSGVGPGTTSKPGDKPQRLLNGALTPQTRKTLQDAMNSPQGKPAAK